MLPSCTVCFPDASVVKNLPANEGDRFNSWVRRFPGGGQPTPVFLPGESHGQRSLAGHSPWGCTESDTSEHTPVVESRVLQGTVMFHVFFAELRNRFWRHFFQNGTPEETEMQNFRLVSEKCLSSSETSPQCCGLWKSMFYETSL